MITTRKNLSINDTSVFKGLAIMLMLWHHLFFKDNGLFDDMSIFNHNIVNYTGIMAKLCVSIFVFFSGYGLAVQAEKKGIGNLWNFYLHRFSKLYLNYWFIWLIFVPIGIFIFHRSFADTYQTHIALKLALDFLGVIKCTGNLGYNATWWFYSCIIILYFLFPLLYKSSKINIYFTLLACVALNYFPFSFLHPIRFFIYAFLCGIVYALYRQKLNHTMPLPLWLLILAVLAIERNNVGILIDIAITISLVEIYMLITLNKRLSLGMAFLGKHSMNIFLFHTFIFSHWFEQQIYSPRNPVLIFILLLFICIIISIALERIKKIVRFNKLVNYISNINIK